MKKYQYQRSFTKEATLSNSLFELLGVVFPEVIAAAEIGRKLGGYWEQASTPFIKFEGDMAVSHVGVLEIPMRLMGETVTVGGIHAVSTHPEFRRRGYYREVMEEVLDYCDNRYDTLVLTTEHPEFYQPFGFRVVKEHIFETFETKSDYVGNRENLRLLNLADITDLKLLHRLLETREPVSNIVGVGKEKDKALFLVNEGSNPIYYASDLDTVILMEIENSILKLFNIVATDICTLQEILERIPQAVEKVEIYFSPERLNEGWNTNAQPLPHMYDGGVLMVRGKFPAEQEKFMLPRSSRC
jgi:ribosomal protein S18 acetylase RimI-like enzyme